MSNFSVPIARTDLTEEEIKSVLEPLESGWLVQGPQVSDFQDKWSAFTGAPNSIAVTSCTSALHLSLAALGFGPGDEAIVPALTWISTANVVEHLGGRVIFCDINLNTFNIDADQIAEKITPATRAILPVHLFGLAADMGPINMLAKKHKLWVVEDAACGFGSLYHGQHVGTFGDTGCFSFHPRKAITTGEGGMVTTGNKDLAEKIQRLRDHGAAISDLQRHLGPKPYLLADHPDAGYNQRMTDIQGAIGAKQMERANDIVLERRRLASVYGKAFADIDCIQTPIEPDGYQHGYQSYPCLFQPKVIAEGKLNRVHESRNALMDDLQKAGISTRPATHAVHMLKFYAEKYSLKPSDFPNAQVANDCSISLPLFHGMKDDEQSYVIQKINKFI
tara:strand:- start:1370 stop:2542 length:1173 start_codon:yes stop_codon:yes gene_type:complete